MTLTSGRFIGHEQDRGIVQFSMQDGAKEIPCAISTSAMDDLERGPQTRSHEREAQFTRLRDRIEARAASKYQGDGVRGDTAGDRAAEH